MQITRPLLAATVDDLSKLRFPLIVTPKIDGIRCLILPIEGTLRVRAVTRSLKPIPNDCIRSYLENLPAGFDGEIVCPDGFRATDSAVMSRSGTPAFSYQVFDYVRDMVLDRPYINRLQELEIWFAANRCAFAQDVKHDRVENLDELLQIEGEALEAGYEGLCMRAPHSPYKNGRSTFREHILLKLKRFKDSEATIIGFEELFRNGNPQQKNELGFAERSSARAGLIPSGVLGAFTVRDLVTNITFSIGSGFTDADRENFWANRSSLEGKVVKYKYQPSDYIAPRHPVFMGFRND